MLEAVMFGLATLKLLAVPFDVLDVDHMPFFPLFSARLVCALRGKRMTATWHEVWGGDYWKIYLGRVAPIGHPCRATGMPGCLIRSSPCRTRRLAGSGRNLPRRQPVYTIPNGIDFETIDQTAASLLAPDVLYAGRLLANKNVDLLFGPSPCWPHRIRHCAVS